MKLLKKITDSSKKKYNDIKKKIDIKNNYTITFKTINKDKKMVLVDKKDKTKLVGDFHFYGTYNNDSQLWTWANIIPDTEISNIKYIEDFRLKAYIFEKNIETSEVVMFFYQFLINDNMIIPTKYVSLITDLILYLSDDIYMFQPTNSINNIQFIGLSKINELY